MRVIVYVEGASDKIAMQELLRDLIDRKAGQGALIEFFETAAGDRKQTLLTKIPVRAVDILANDPTALVAVVPDLYPRNKAFPHETAQELAAGVLANFRSAFERKKVEDERVARRFRVFCFKHDLEALVLAAEDGLRSRLGARSLKPTWTIPVEDQDHEQPPKHVVEQLFRDHNRRYVDTIDAPIILHAASYQELAEKK